MQLALTIDQTIRELHEELMDYIEATYHISHPYLVKQRRELLEKLGVIHQRPFIESTPKYITNLRFDELGLDPAVLEIFSKVSSEGNGLQRIIHDPPYHHQAESVKNTLLDNKSLVVMTGTGSGKTECFLLPILGKLATEAFYKSDSFKSTPATRAMILYPMNALVNDQLGRLRLLFGDKRIAGQFINWSGRPARFARYTSRTLYPGVRSEKKDVIRLAPIKNYYIDNLVNSEDQSSPDNEFSKNLVKALKERGKWPAKHNLKAWYGKKGSRWRDRNTGEFLRCVADVRDPELFIRHEIQTQAPDLLVTNYSMLEYMLMRPLERPIFEQTKNWLEENPDEKFLLVVDEAHLYRGAAGAEVALLIRRLRMRLGIPPDRLQIICTSASFKDPEYAAKFGAQLTGKNQSDFVTVQGQLQLHKTASVGTNQDAELFSELDLEGFYKAESDEGRTKYAEEILKFRKVKSPYSLKKSLHNALYDYPPMKLLINETMKNAIPVDELNKIVFPDSDQNVSAKALTSLIALGSLARRDEQEAGLLPCRVHSFYRGLAGLWICMDQHCTEISSSDHNVAGGKLFSQPRDVCPCGGRVLELFTCRKCGASYARAYTSDVEDPDFLWSEAGGEFRAISGVAEALQPLDILLEEPIIGETQPADYDLITGRLDPPQLGERVRKVHIKKDRSKTETYDNRRAVSLPGEFVPCALCGESAAFGRPSVQDHQTKGDQPFQALITKQIQIQPPNPVKSTKFAPLRGRKVLIFSDSRQMAARLAPNIQTYSTQDTMRPLIVGGFDLLQQSQLIAPQLSLEDLYLAVLLASKKLGVRLRPSLKTGETFNEEIVVEEAILNGVLENDQKMFSLWRRLVQSAPPVSLLLSMTKCLNDQYYGLESLALASIVETSENTEKILDLPDIQNVATNDEEKLALARLWIRSWRKTGFWLSRMPTEWWKSPRRDGGVHPRSGSFTEIQRFINDASSYRLFDKEWKPKLLSWFTEAISKNNYKLLGFNLSLKLDGDWAYCQACRTTQRPYPGRSTCINCTLEKAETINPDKDSVFKARKGYYRSSTVDALKSPFIPPISLIAAEHTAQLNAAQADQVFSKAEEHELLFQDVDLGGVDEANKRQAIDVLSCTTTMEVGIDIGALSGVSLRNMPPSRANYQQRSGRAGRRGNAIATVTAFGSADSHDEHYFTNPSQMISGDVDDPRLSLNNIEIIRRHVTAFILQKYHHAKLPFIEPDQQPHLFAVLGTVADFKGKDQVLNRFDFEQWIRSNELELKKEISEWLPTEITDVEKLEIIENFCQHTIGEINNAIEVNLDDDVGTGDTEDEGPLEASDDSDGYTTSLEIQREQGVESPLDDLSAENLLDRLLYKGVLPRYAFPTDVASFYVFDRNKSSNYKTEYKYAPSQGLSVALSQYAPGKEVWIDNKLYRSGAIYSPMKNERYKAWQEKKLYYECSNCKYAKTVPLESGIRHETTVCEACNKPDTFGPARYWLRPPGFAHPDFIEEGTTPDDQPARSHATRAKLTVPTPSEEENWEHVNDQIRVHHTRQHLLVTNTGPREEGYTYCTICGLIEPSSTPDGIVGAGHRKPFPNDRDQTCRGGGATTGLVLGTDFITDVLLISLKVKDPVNLSPGYLSTDVALRTLSEAISLAATTILELEPQELQAEYRPALTPSGQLGLEAEIYLYDTLPGGAGFSRRAGDLGLNLFNEALELLNYCPDSCDRSCYRCLRSYKNKFEHDLLDRSLGASLLRHLLTGQQPSIDEKRYIHSTDMLYNDLSRQNLKGVTINRDHTIKSPGLPDLVAPIYVKANNGEEVIIGLHNPLTPGHPENTILQDYKEYSLSHSVLIEDELKIRRNLPWVTDRIIEIING